MPFGYFNESVIVFINGESAETIFPGKQFESLSYSMSHMMMMFFLPA